MNLTLIVIQFAFDRFEQRDLEWCGSRREHSETSSRTSHFFRTIPAQD
jgi:hypothetical protein